MNESLQNEVDRLKKELGKLKADPQRLRLMDADALRELKAEMHCGIGRVQEAEMHLESQRKCVVCMVNRKTVVFDGCDHCAVCPECADRLAPKRCPICRAHFNITREIRM